MRSVLLTEDDFLIRTVAVDALEEAGFDCVEASNGATAIELMAGSRELHAIIVDIGLPDMSGDQVIEAARKLRPGIPIIRCSGDGRGDGQPDVHILAKPYTPTDLCRFLETIVAPAVP